MPSRYSALAGSLVVSLPILFGAVPGVAQGPSGAYAAQDDAYHPPQQPGYGGSYPSPAPGGYIQAQAPAPYGQTYSPPPRQTPRPARVGRVRDYECLQTSGAAAPFPLA